MRTTGYRLTCQRVMDASCIVYHLLAFGTCIPAAEIVSFLGCSLIFFVFCSFSFLWFWLCVSLGLSSLASLLFFASLCLCAVVAPCTSIVRAITAYTVNISKCSPMDSR